MRPHRKSRLGFSITDQSHLIHGMDAETLLAAYKEHLAKSPLGGATQTPKRPKLSFECLGSNGRSMTVQVYDRGNHFMNQARAGQIAEEDGRLDRVVRVRLLQS